MRLFYASDIHGSETCWRKFMNSAKVYRCDVIVMGGDLTGKGIVPIVEQPDGTWTAAFKSRQLTIRDTEQLQTLERDVTFNGMYPYRCTPDEVAKARNAEEFEQLFDDVMRRTFQRWLEVGREKLTGTGTACYVMPGNDDTWVIDEAFDPHDPVIINCDRRVTELGDGYSMLSLGYANPTPWDSPREVPEERLAQMIDELAGQVPDMSRAIFNLHVPPFDSELDVAPALDADFKLKTSGGQMVMAAVGSTAVREAIERYQPLLALHGHIHESKGARRIGRTLCINPGSSYSLGQLDGVLVQLRRDDVKRHQFVVG